MFRFERLLVPVDFSADSEAALRYALDLATQLQGSQEILVVHVVDKPLPAMLATSRGASMGRHEQEHEEVLLTQQRLDTLVAGLSPGVEHLETLVVVGQPVAEVIARVAAERNSDLLVIGTEGRGGALLRLVLGSTMQQLQHLCPCPILTVHDPSQMVG